MVNPAEEVRWSSNGLRASASLPAAEGNVNRSFYKPGQEYSLVGYFLTWPVSTIRPLTRREFGIAAHLQRTT